MSNVLNELKIVSDYSEIVDEAIPEDDMILVTHGGIFHADDVLSTALMLGTVTQTNIYLIRTSKVTDELIKYATCIFDVGGGQFDHHQPGRKLREDKTPYAAFGLLWEKYGRDYIAAFEDDDEVIDAAWKAVDEDFVKHVDAVDNGIKDPEGMMMAHAIGSFNPNWDEDATNSAVNEKFMAALKVANSILSSLVSSAVSKARAKSEVIKAIKNRNESRVLILDRFMPWQEYLLAEETANDILYVIYPSIRGGYNVQAVPDEPDSFGMRKALPEEWINELPEGCTFVHPARFLCNAGTLDDAKKIALLAAEK